MGQFTVTHPSSKPVETTSLPVHLSLNAEARTDDEVWAGKSSASTRRKLQNRLNQRAHRRRIAEEKASKVHVFEIVVPEQTPPSLTSSSASDTDYTLSDRTRSTSPSETGSTSSLLISSASWTRRFEPFLLMTKGERILREDQQSAQSDTDTVRFEEGFLRKLKAVDFYSLPGDDHLLSLMYYNVFRGLNWNARALGCDVIAMHDDDYPSPFIDGSAIISRIPPDLRPTHLQRTVPHHPCFDIFPDPVVRETGIQNTHRLEHGMLCMTLAGRNSWNEHERKDRNGLVIWGPPEDASSWEVTEGFVRNFGWLVKGSYMLECSTNRWRWRRGEGAIFFA